MTLLNDFITNNLGGGFTLTADDVAYIFAEFDTDGTPGISQDELCTMINDLFARHREDDDWIMI